VVETLVDSIEKAMRPAQLSATRGHAKLLSVLMRLIQILIIFFSRTERRQPDGETTLLPTMPSNPAAGE